MAGLMNAPLQFGSCSAQGDTCVVRKRSGANMEYKTWENWGTSGKSSDTVFQQAFKLPYQCLNVGESANLKILEQDESNPSKGVNPKSWWRDNVIYL
jgi:hypothetical protein